MACAGDFADRGGFNIVGFLGAVSIAALWQLAYAPMSPDYSAICPTAPTIKRLLRQLFWLHSRLLFADGARGTGGDLYRQ